jgi:hypothetical protein
MRCMLLLATLTTGWFAVADATPEKLAVEEAMVPSHQPQMMIYVRNKHPESMTNRRRPSASLRSRCDLSGEHLFRP